MNVKLVQDFSNPLLEVLPSDAPMSTEQASLDVVSACYAHDTWQVLLHAEALSAEFFDLKTGLAGQMLQKWQNYQVRVALVLPQDAPQHIRFQEMIGEANRGQAFRTFATRQDAGAWLGSL